MQHDPKPSEWRATLRLGDAGLDVSAWRLLLALEGYDLAGPGEPNTFTTAVHNATIAWQKAHGLRADGVVGAATRSAIGADRVTMVSTPFDPAAIPYVEARHWSRDVGPQRKTLVVIHCMEYPETATSAEWCAGFFAGESSPRASAHYAVDSDTVVNMVHPERVAWHAPGANTNGIGIELAGYARQSRAQWLDDDFSLPMLVRASKLVGWLCGRFDIPVTYVHGETLRRGAAGITTHAEVSRVFKKSSHWDPGPHFPMNDFLAWVRAALPPPVSRR